MEILEEAPEPIEDMQACTTFQIWESSQPLPLSLEDADNGLSCLSPVLYLEGSVLVFEDIFRLIAFYCVSR